MVGSKAEAVLSGTERLHLLGLGLIKVVPVWAEQQIAINHGAVEVVSVHPCGDRSRGRHRIE